MKRLLAYLFIVLGFGLVFKSNANSSVYCVDNRINEKIENFKPDYSQRLNEFFYFSSKSGVCIGGYTQVTFEKYNNFKKLFNKKIKTEIGQNRDKLVDELIEKFSSQILNNWSIPTGLNYSKDSSIKVHIEINQIGRIKKFEVVDFNKIQKNSQKKILVDSVISAIKLSENLDVPSYNHSVFIYHNLWKDLILTFDPKEINLKIAKIKPSQTQLVKLNEKYICVTWQVSSYLISENKGENLGNRCTEKVYQNKNPKLYNKFMQVMLKNSLSSNPKNTIISLKRFNDIKSETQIAKAEPSQTQNTSKKYCRFEGDGRRSTNLVVEVEKNCPSFAFGGFWYEISNDEYSKINSLIIDEPYLCINHIEDNLKFLSVTKFKKLIKNRNCELKIFRGKNKNFYQRFVNISFYEDTDQIFPWMYKEDSADKNIAWRRAVLTKRANKIIDDFNKENVNKIAKFESSQVQVAKVEPSQKQKMYQGETHLIKPDTWVYFVRIVNNEFVSLSKLDADNFLNNKKNMNNYKFDTIDNLFKYQRNIGGRFRTDIRISKKLHDTLFYDSTSVLDGFGMGMGDYNLSKKKRDYLKFISTKIDDYKPYILKDLIDEYTEDNQLKNNLLAYFDQENQILTPKKKVKVAKVEEPKQEEFKPENKDIDNDAPVIEIAQNIIVSDTSYVIEGKVSDKSDKIFVEIDGQPIEVKKGKFKANRYSPVDEQIKIVAIDQWGNKSKPKLVNIKINLDETAIAEKLEPLNPSNIKTKSSKNKIAIIIGIENYAEAPKANYANLDAQYFFDYARRAFGVKKQNINLLINEDATVVKTDKALSLWLKSKIKKNRSELIIFFAGHGLASTDGKELYLLPQDGNPDRLKRTALSRTDLFREIIELNPKSVTMFLDTCYSGVSRDEQMLLASARPLRIVADEQEGIPDNFTIFSASKLDQISSGLTEVNHGIFSYYLMKGLEGYADFNEDKKITNGELLAYMDENVSQKAAEQGREQNPSLAGDPNKVLVSFN